MGIWTIEFDGGAAPNPGYASCAYRITGQDKAEYIDAWNMEGDKRTNNEAEWEALVIALERLLTEIDQSPEKVHIIGDSNLVISQLKGSAEVKNAKLKPYWRRAFIRMYKLQSTEFVFELRPRSDNAFLDKLCKNVRISPEETKAN
jgi:ribonuclease HI